VTYNDPGFVQVGNRSSVQPGLLPGKDMLLRCFDKAAQYSVQPEPQLGFALSYCSIVQPHLHKTPCWLLIFYEIAISLLH
jgi:hypothetical protein